MADVIAVANQKGGVGKTTTVVNVAAYSVLADRRTLVIDIDGQGNATSVLASEPADISVFAGGQPGQTRFDRLDIVAASADLPDDDRRLSRSPDGRHVLSECLAAWRDSYDIILIDCPPSLGTLPVNALVAADSLIIPIQCEYYAMEGLGQMLAGLQDLTDLGESVPEVAGILLTMYDDALPLSCEVATEIRRHFLDRVYTNPIPRDVALAAAPSHGRTIHEHDPLSEGGLAYLALTREILHGH